MSATVEAPWAQSTTDGLARFLSEQWDTTVSVTLDGVASAGARRRNVLFVADDGTATHRLVATIVQHEALLIQDFLLEPGAIAFAAANGVPVAPLVGATADPAYVAGPFFVTRRVDGETVPRRVLRLVETHDLGPRLVRQCGQALAALHAAPLGDAPAGLPYGDSDPAMAALERLSDSMEDLLQPSPVFALAYRWLELHRPPSTTPITVVHGDFRTGNLIVGEDGLRAVLDWEIVRFGDPMEDLAWTTMRMWRFGQDRHEVGGFASTGELAGAYRDAGGWWDADRFAWWQVCGTLRWGIGLALQAIAHLDGSVPSVVMAASGRRVAEQEFDVLTLVRRHLAR